jgi:hypothetical protein
MKMEEKICASCGVLADKVKFRGKLLNPASVTFKLFSEKSKLQLDASFCLICSKKLYNKVSKDTFFTLLIQGE